MKVYTCASTGQSITLTNLVGGGGEGKIWQTNRNGYVAKIYEKPPTFEIVQKLEVMVAFPPQEPNSHLNHISFAWPKSLLKDVYGGCVGFLMPEIKGGRELLDIYNPSKRKSQKLEIDWRFLHTTALNIASIIEAIHAAGYILGDIKPQNILVNNRALPSIIDTDSFQVRHPLTGELYRCEVGSPGFTPPELIGKDFSNFNQTQFHDNFRLAVIIYQLLFFRSPFQGKWTGAGEVPEPEELVQRGLWAYAPDMSIQPLEIMPLDIVHPEIQRSFLKCFNDGHINPNLRPTASYWKRVLKAAINELTLCGKFDNHYYSQNYGKCYWCECATNFKVDYFPGIVRQPQSQVATSRRAPNSNNQSNPAPQTVPSSSSTAASSVKQNQSINSSNTTNNNPNTSNSASKKLNNSQISNANKSVSKTVQSSSSSGQNNGNSKFIPWLFFPSLCLVAYTFIHYIRFEGFTNSLGVWVGIIFSLGTLAGSMKLKELEITSKINLAICLPALGVINCFINPKSFLSGWSFVFPVSFIIWMLVLLSQEDIKTTNTNSISEILARRKQVRIIEILAIIFVVILAGHTYYTKVVFDTSAFTKVILQEDFQNPNINDWSLNKGGEIKDEALHQVVLNKNTMRLSTWNKSWFTNLEDVDFSADATKITGSEYDFYGIIAKNYNYRFYFLLIIGNRYISFGKITTNKMISKTEIDLKDLTVSPNTTNRLRIVCNGNTIIGYINDKMIGSFEDNSISSGSIGFISSSGEREGTAVYFDNVLVKIK